MQLWLFTLYNFEYLIFDHTCGIASILALSWCRPVSETSSPSKLIAPPDVGYRRNREKPRDVFPVTRTVRTCMYCRCCFYSTVSNKLQLARATKGLSSVTFSHVILIVEHFACHVHNLMFHTTHLIPSYRRYRCVPSVWSPTWRLSVPAAGCHDNAIWWVTFFTFLSALQFR